jgi:hypothetical protein
MCAQFQSVTALLATRGLIAPNLNLLVADNTLYDVLAIQPVGRIAVRDDFLGPEDRVTAEAKFTQFLTLAAQRQPDLAFSPEYSCPWSSITAALQNDLGPGTGKLWALGAESVTRAQLEAVKQASPQIEWFHEQYPARPGQFFDPVVYFFTATTQQGAPQRVGLVQFKTRAMEGVIERDRLIVGDMIYYFQNHPDYLRLLTIICSESMGFTPADTGHARLDNHGYVILHPQLNLDPRHDAMSEYRGWLYRRNVGDRQEIFTLNWAKGFTFNVGQIPPSAYGGSTIYSKAPAFDRTDRRLELNHRKGMYYVRWEGKRADLNLLNYHEHVFHWKMSKAEVEMAIHRSSRTGPLMHELWRWDQGVSQWTPTDPDDGFAAYVGGYGAPPTCNFFPAPATTALARERLFTLSAGKLNTANDWYAPQNIPACIAETDERSKRLTFTHDEVQASRDFRALHMDRYIRLNQILSTPQNFEGTIVDLRGDWQLQPPDSSSHFRHNLVSQSGRAAGATAIFLGMAAAAEANGVRDNLVDAWTIDHTRRLVVWHDTPGGLQVAGRPLPTITDENEHPASVTRRSPPP